MKYVLPDYQNGLVNVISSVEKYYGIKNSHSTLKMLDEKLNETKPKNIVVALFDGFGYELLIKNKDICPFLYSNLKGYISSTFPSTTMAARTTVESGLDPVEHGWMGWDMYFKCLDEVISLSKNTVKETKKKAASYHVANKLLKYTSVVDKINELENHTGTKITVYSNHKNESLFKMRLKIRLITHRKGKNYVYAYYNEPDHIMHQTGTDSLETLGELTKIDNHFKKLCNGLKNTLIIALADHGHINSGYITLSNYPKIMNMLERIISIDNRACAFYVKKEYKNEFKHVIKKVLKDDFIVKTKDEIKEEHFYGYGKENKYFKDGLGDYFAIGIGDKVIRYTDKTSKHVSSHSGLTKEEMLVPLIMINKK